jgi:hypothetical protein
MKSCSSTSVFRRLGDGYPAAFFGLVFAVFALANQLLMRGYPRVEGRVFGRAWLDKKERLLPLLRAGRINSVFVGDSTVDVGVRMDLVDPAGFNLARSGLDPSRLPSIARLLLGAPMRRPRFVLLSLTPAHLSEDAWPEPLNLPLLDVAEDAARLYYADSNSFKPLLCGGCGYLTSLADKAAERAQALSSPRAAEPGPWSQQTATTALKLRVRRTNFRLVEDFKNELAAGGVRTVWVQLPTRRGFAESLASSPSSRDFERYSESELARIFGSDAIDLRGSVDDSLFTDDIHVDPRGAQRLSVELGRRLAERFPDFRSAKAPGR